MRIMPHPKSWELMGGVRVDEGPACNKPSRVPKIREAEGEG
jgi:hypothetical protein